MAYVGSGIQELSKAIKNVMGIAKKESINEIRTGIVQGELLVCYGQSWPYTCITDMALSDGMYVKFQLNQAGTMAIIVGA